MAGTSKGVARKRRPPGEESRIATRRARALELRVAGGTYQAIARELSVSVKTAWEDVQAGLSALWEETQETAREVLVLELRRLDDALAVTYRLLAHPASAVRLQAVDRITRLGERRARLFGLDAPTKQETRTLDLATLTSEQLARLERGERLEEVLTDA